LLVVDDSTKKQAGRQIEGVGHYRNGAGSARQEYRTLRGLNFVWGLRRVPGPGGAGQPVRGPLGLSLYLKEEHADKLKLPDHSRSALAREIGDFVAAHLPTRQSRVLGDGGYLSGVGFLGCQTHLGSSSQCVRGLKLRPGFRYKAALR
jgi:hypothetical protein